MKIKNLFVVFLLLITSCGKEDANLLEKADKEYQKKNLKTAIDIYKHFVQKYPESSKAPEALFKLAQIYLNDLRLPKEAVGYFEQIVQKYPNTREAMNALFMLGFIYANEIHDYDKAREHYQKFLEQYPNSELAISAKFELENLGKEPEKILTK